MARIRTTKPEFWTDGDVMDLTPSARLLFLGSWNFTLCDHGHLPDDARRLKMQVLPADEVMLVRVDGEWAVLPIDPVALVDELLASGRLARIETGGRTYLHVVRFAEHQKLDKRWSPRCSACQSLAAENPDNAQPPRNSPKLPETLPRTGQDGTGQDSAAAAADGAAAASPAGDDIPTSLAILRDKLRAHTPLRALRFDKLRPDHVDQLARLIELHGDGPLVEIAVRTLRPTPPVHVTAFLGTWAAMPPPGQRLAAVKEPECSDHPGKPARTCSGCAADRLAGDRP